MQITRLLFATAILLEGFANALIWRRGDTFNAAYKSVTTGTCKIRGLLYEDIDQTPPEGKAGVRVTRSLFCRDNYPYDESSPYKKLCHWHRDDRPGADLMGKVVYCSVSREEAEAARAGKALPPRPAPDADPTGGAPRAGPAGATKEAAAKTAREVPLRRARWPKDVDDGVAGQAAEKEVEEEEEVPRKRVRGDKAVAGDVAAAGDADEFTAAYGQNADSEILRPLWDGGYGRGGR